MRQELARYHRELIRVVARRIGSEAVAGELLQAAFVRGPETRLPRHGENAIHWLGRVLSEAHQDWLRSSHRLRAGEFPGRAVLTPGNGGAEVARECVTTVLSFLKPPLAEVLVQWDVSTELGDYRNDLTGPAARLDEARDALFRGMRQICRTCVQHARLDCDCQQGNSALT